MQRAWTGKIGSSMIRVTKTWLVMMEDGRTTVGCGRDGGWTKDYC